MGSSFSCDTSPPLSVSTGALSTPGVWSFELQVNDSASESVTSGSVTVFVSSLPPSTLTAACNHASVVIGTTITCKATVSGFGSAPTGSVAWSSSSLGLFSGTPCTLSPHTTYSVCGVTFKPTAAGSSVILTGSYGGDAKNFQSAGTYNLAVTKKVTKMMVFCTPRSVAAGSPKVMICEAKVIGYLPTGTVSWSQSGTGSVSFTSTTCTLTPLTQFNRATCYVATTGSTAGHVTLTANYTGDSNNQGSSRTTTLTIRKAPTITTISCVPLFTINVPITCTAAVTGGYPSQTGTASFTVSGKVSITSPSNTCTLTGGNCSVTVTIIAGKGTVRGTYSGDANNRASHGTAKLTTVLSTLACGATINANTILGNNIGPCKKNGLVIGHNGITFNCNGHTITGNSTNMFAGIYLDGKTGVTVENCKVTAFRYGFLLNSSSNSNTLTGNTANSNHVDGFLLNGTSNSNKLNGNTASSNAYFGFYLSGSSNKNTLTGNTASNNINGSGFYLSGSSNDTLITNTANSNHVDGFLLNGTSNSNKLNGNTASGNVNDGFYLSSSSSNTLTGNTASSSYDGFLLNGTSNSNKLNGNTASGNVNDGFYLSSSSSNTLTGNTA
ncbi:MAG: NosD domain-containing protein, partial [Nitrososphaerales archaeon]